MHLRVRILITSSVRHMTIRACQILFTAILWMVSPNWSLAGTLPTVDLTKGTKYSLLNGSGLSIVKGRQIAGARTSDAILDKNLLVVVSPGKSFTMQSDRCTGLVGVAPDDSIIKFYAFSAECATAQSVKAKVQEVGAALGFDSSAFNAAIDSGWSSPEKGDWYRAAEWMLV